MPTCKNCHKQWRWSKAVKATLTLSVSLTCPYCKEKQYYSARCRKRSGIVPAIIIALIMTANLLFGPSIIFVIMILSMIPLFIFINPFFIELSNEEEPLF